MSKEKILVMLIANYLKIPRKAVSYRPSVALEGGTFYQIQIRGGILEFTIPPTGNWVTMKNHIDINLNAGDDDVCVPCNKKYDGHTRLSCAYCGKTTCVSCYCDNLRAGRGTHTCVFFQNTTKNRVEPWNDEELDEKIAAFKGRLAAHK